MAETEFDTYITTSFEGFVDELVSVGRVRREDAPDEVRRQREKLLPGGMHTDGMLFFVGEVDGAPVGWIWLGLPGTNHHPKSAWVYDIEVEPTQRGNGYGRSLLLAAETELKRRGVHQIGLNVFGSNTIARELYSGLGYEVTSQNMSKQL